MLLIYGQWIRLGPARGATLRLTPGRHSALDLVTAARPELSRSEARRLLAGGGVHLEGMRVSHPEQLLEVGGGQVLRAGRRRWFRIEG